ncbi:MAG TPA: hypothetical protein HA364_00935 [Thermoplasmata archaeon]|nr:hypothetical protein [Thermoplasmata archaeon]
MAKKRKKDKEDKEDYEFTPPEFDEKEFLLKELRDTKTVLLTVGYAAVFGIVAGVMANLDQDLVPLGLAIVIAGLVSLKYFYPFIKVDVTQFQKKNWAGNIAWFFFTFLAVWVLMFNFPIADHADPSVTEVTVWVDNGTNVTAIDYEYVDSVGAYVWVPRWGESLDSMIHASAAYTVNITAKVADNGELVTTLVSVDGGENFLSMTPEESHRYGFLLTGDQILSGSLTFEIRAADDAGHVTVFMPASAIPVSA